MNVIAALLGQVARRTVSEAGPFVFLIVLAAVFGLAGLGFGLAAIAILLADAYGMVIASLILSAICFAFVGVVILTAYLVEQRSIRRARRRALIDGAVTIGPALVRASPIATLVMAGAAAHILARLR